MESTALHWLERNWPRIVNNIIFYINCLVKLLLTKKFAEVMYLRFSGCQRARLARKQPDNLGWWRTGQTRESDRMSPSANS